MSDDKPSAADRAKLLAQTLAGSFPDAHGRYGPFGGRYVPETLVPAHERLEQGVARWLGDADFQREFQQELTSWVGRPTALSHAPRLSQRWGAEVWLKREDLAHTGAHKINNALGQALLARRLGAKRIVAETGAGQHGVASAAACARLGLPCTVYMGAVDMERQAPNVGRMRLLGATVVSVTSGDQTLRAAIDEAMRDWVGDPEGTYYLLGSAVGAHPYPYLVRELQSIIGREARAQIQAQAGGLPDLVIACVGGGSNAIGLFHPFIADEGVRLIGVEAGGCGDSLGKHAARFHSGKKSGGGRVGVLQGTMSYVLQDTNGQIATTHSISAGLDYSAIGPEHAFLHDSGRAEYTQASDAEALEGLRLCARVEGIIPALETAHAILPAIRLAHELSPDDTIIVNVSGRGDKDVQIVAELEGE
jgi:tryptophan synthase beta chain